MLLHRDCRKNVRIFGAVQRVSLAQLDFYFYGIAGLEGGASFPCALAFVSVKRIS
jgi:hypothetical protein